MTDEARERWKQKHRWQRKRAPKVARGRARSPRVLAALATIAFILLGRLGRLGLRDRRASVCGYLFLRLLRRPALREWASENGADAYVD